MFTGVCPPTARSKPPLMESTFMEDIVTEIQEVKASTVMDDIMTEIQEVKVSLQRTEVMLNTLSLDIKSCSSRSLFWKDRSSTASSVMRSSTPEMLIHSRRSSRSVQRTERTTSTWPAPSVHIPEEEGEEEDMPFTLPESWPRSIKLREGLRTNLPTEQCRSHVIPTAVSSGIRKSEMSWKTYWSEGPWKKLHAIHPNSHLVIAIQASGIFVLLVDYTVLPLVLAWDLPIQGWLAICTVGSVFFWTTDIIINFLVGFETDGELERRFDLAARHYLTGRFRFDIIVVLFDWMSIVLLLVLRDSSSIWRNVMVLRISKLTRLPRLFRVISVLPAIMGALDHLESFVGYSFRAFHVTFRIMCIFVTFLWCNHIIACTWYAIGRHAPTDTDHRWLETEDTTGRLHSEMPMSYQYLTSMHWSMAQGSVPGLFAVSSWERSAGIAVRLLDKVFNCTLISSLAAAMVGLQMRGSKRAQDLRILRTYLHQHNVPPSIALSVIKQAETRIMRKTRVGESDVKILGLLSSSLRSEMRVSMFDRHIQSLPVLRFWAVTSSSFTRELCSGGVELLCLVDADDLFQAAMTASKAYYLVSGQLQYTQEPESAKVDIVTTTRVHPNSWLCEAALWTEWTHVGTAEALKECELMELDATGLIHTVLRHRLIRELAVSYGCAFHQRLITAGNQPTDLCVPNTAWTEIVPELSSDVQKFIGLSVIHKEVVAPHLQAVLLELEDQVNQGRCALVRDSDGEVKRFVKLSVLWLRLQDGRFLVELGKTRQTTRVTCRLPATKHQSNENAEDALTRLINRRLREFRGHLQRDCEQTQEEERLSSRYRIQTRYSQTEFTYTLTEEVSLGSQTRHMGRQKTSLFASEKVRQMPFPLRTIRAVETINGSEKLTTFYAWLTEDQFSACKEVSFEGTLKAILGSISCFPSEPGSDACSPKYSISSCSSPDGSDADLER